MQISDGAALDRFVEAQAPVIEAVLGELADGRKRTHWMWFIFPQLAGLGHSAMAQHYALSSLDEAASYLRHPILGSRLTACTDLVLKVEGKSVNAIFGGPDDMKFRSSMTLFASLPKAPPIFADALAKYFDGQPDPLTIRLLSDRGA